MRFFNLQERRFTVASIERYSSVWRLIHALLFCVSVILILVITSLESSPSTPAHAQQHYAIASPAITLELRKPVVREVAAGQPQHYSVSLTAGQYARLAVECWGTNLKVALYEPGGRMRAESICYRGGRTPVSFIADAS